jgi:two-component system response regulator YesN
MPIKRIIKILIVDDSLFFRTALQKVLDSDAGVEVIGSAGSAAEAEKKIKFLKLSQLERKLFQVAVIMSDPIPEGNEFSDESKDLADFAIYNISKEIIETNNIGMVLFSSKKIIAIAAYDDAALQHHIFCNCLEEIRSAIEMHLKFTVTIGKGCVYGHWSELHNSYNEALAALNYCNLVGNNRIIFIKDIEPQRRSTAIFQGGLERDFLSAVKMGVIQAARKAVRQSMQEVEQGNGGISQQRCCILTILMGLIREAENIGIVDSQIVAESEMKNVFDIWSTDEMEALVLNSAEKLMNCIAQNRKNSCTAVIEQAKNIIAERYKDPDLSLDAVCDALHLSASYFRAVFKKETGTTFVNYLTELRMEKAKDLILTTAMKNYEIATETGYIDPHYFSYCFKKHFKMSPNELRESVNIH